MQKTSQDKRTPNLADAREKPQDGENPWINSSYFYIKMFSTERVQRLNCLAQFKVKIALSISAVKLQPLLESQRWSKQQ